MFVAHRGINKVLGFTGVSVNASATPAAVAAPRQIPARYTLGRDRRYHRSIARTRRNPRASLCLWLVGGGRASFTAEAGSRCRLRLSSLLTDPTEDEASGRLGIG